MRPYYIFHCDPVIGAGHFRTSVWKGMEIMEGLRGHTSGIGIPTYVVDSPHGGGKIPMMPNYLVSMSDDAVVLRNYEGMLIRYQAEDKPNSPQHTNTRGVSGLLQGDKTALMPEGNERMTRRRKLNVIDPGYETSVRRPRRRGRRYPAADPAAAHDEWPPTTATPRTGEAKIIGRR